MSRKPNLSRRDFLKVSAAGWLGLELAALGLSSTACGPRREPSGELPKTKFSRETIILNGKITSVDDKSLDIATLMHIDDVKFKLDQARQGSLPRNNPGGYEGATFPVGWEPDFDRTVIVVNTTDSGDLFSQVVISRKEINTPVPEGVSQGWDEFWDAMSNASAYNEHSLLVVDKNKNALWFDNVESVTDKGKTRISVDGSTGKVMQITTNRPNLIESWFKGEAPNISLSEINMSAGRSTFERVSTPFSPNFLNILRRFIARLPNNYTKAQKLDVISYYFSGARLNQNDLEVLRKNLAIDPNDPSDQTIDAISRFNLHFPYSDEELAFVSSALSESMSDFVSGTVKETYETTISNFKSPGEYFNVENVRKLVEMRTKLPMGAPELYFVQTKKQDGTQKWHLVGRYTTRENDQTKVISNQTDGFGIGEYWITLGEIDGQIVDNGLLREQEKIVEDFPLSEIIQKNPTNMKPLADEVIGNANVSVEVRRVNPEAVTYGWDPSENDTKVKIKPGLMIEDQDGKSRFLGLRQDDFWNKNILDLPLYDNRWLPLLGNSPNVLKDVNDQVVRLIKKGYTSTSIFGLDPEADFSIYGHLDSRDPNSYVNYDFLRDKFPAAILGMVQPGQFLGGTDNAMLVYSENGGTPVQIHKYDGKGNLVDNINVAHPIIIAPQEIGYYVGTGDPYIVMAVDGETNDSYVIDLKDIFMLGARSTEKLRAVAVAEVAAVAALLYGGYAAITNPEAAGAFLKSVIGGIASKLIPS
jgi:hypothetical protein